MNRPNWTIRPIPPEAAEDIYPLHSASFEQEGGDFLSPESFRAIAAWPWTSLLAARTEEGQGQYTGYVIFRRIGNEAELLSVAVAPDFRGRGMGKALLKNMLEDLRECGAGVVFLEVECENRPAIGLYESLGFVWCGTRKGYYRSKNGKENDALILKFDIC